MNRAPFNTTRLKLPLCFAQAPLSVFFFLWPPCDVLACVRICQVRPESSGLIDGKRIHCKRAQGCWLFFLFGFFQSGRCLRPSHLPRRCGAFTAAAFVAHIRRGRIPRAVIRVHLAAVSGFFSPLSSSSTSFTSSSSASRYRAYIFTNVCVSL